MGTVMEDSNSKRQPSLEGGLVRNRQPSYASLKNEGEIGRWWIPHTELELKEELGAGANATVFRAVWRTIDVAVKVLKDKVDEKELFQEIEILHTVRHPLIVQFLGATIDTHSRPVMVMELVPGGKTLQRCLDANSMWLSEKRMVALQLAQVLLFLHSCSPAIIHRDIKPDNIFVLGDKIKLADFNLSKFISHHTPGENAQYTMTGNTGTLRYMAPEVYLHKHYNHKVDVFSYGMILFNLFAPPISRPFRNASKSEYNDFVNNQRVHCTAVIPDSKIRGLVEKCILYDADARPSFGKIVEELNDVHKVDYCTSFLLCPVFGASASQSTLANVADPGSESENIGIQV